MGAVTVKVEAQGKVVAASDSGQRKEEEADNSTDCFLSSLAP